MNSRGYGNSYRFTNTPLYNSETFLSPRRTISWGGSSIRHTLSPNLEISLHFCHSASDSQYHDLASRLAAPACLVLSAVSRPVAQTRNFSIGYSPLISSCLHSATSIMPGSKPHNRLLYDINVRFIPSLKFSSFLAIHIAATLHNWPFCSYLILPLIFQVTGLIHQGVRIPVYGDDITATMLSREYRLKGKAKLCISIYSEGSYLRAWLPTLEIWCGPLCIDSGYNYNGRLPWLAENFGEWW